jgi:predicted nucleic acid-binding protein
LIQREKGKIKPALDFVSKIRTSKSLRVVWIESDGRRGNRELSKYDDKKDQGLGFWDWVSFSIMNNLSIKNAFTFDAQFRKAGFNMSPS